MVQEFTFGLIIGIPFVEKYGEWPIYDLDLKRYAKVSSIIKENRWCWPSSNSVKLMKIKENLGHHHLGNEDLPIWLPNPKKGFTCTSMWDKNQKRKSLVLWSHIIWHKFTILRQVVITWMGMGKLSQRINLIVRASWLVPFVCFATMKRKNLTIFSSNVTLAT